MSDARIQHVGDRVLVIANDLMTHDEAHALGRKLIEAATRARYMDKRWRAQQPPAEGSTVGEVEAS